MKRAMCMLLLVGCAGDPVKDRAEEAPGPRHRAGQPCTACHREDGEAKPFSVAGTVFTKRGEARGAEGVVVELSDRAGTRRGLMTNEAGSFVVTPDEWTPAWPVKVRLVFAGGTKEMTTPIQREGSCAKCHADPRGPTSAGALFIAEEPR